MMLEEFRASPVIQELAEKRRWTCSTAQKMPIDMRALIDHGEIRGAKYADGGCLAELDEIVAFMDSHGTKPSNFAYYLSAPVDGYVVLDVEPKCPEELKAKLLETPCLYAERSMSGKGIHMIFKAPAAAWEKYPAARTKVALKQADGYYEVLQTHYCTFTGNIIPHGPANPADAPAPAFVAMYEALAATAKAKAAAYTADATVEAIEKVDLAKIPEAEAVAEAMAGMELPPLDRYGDDHSRHEFGCAIKIISRIEWEERARGLRYSDEQRITIAYAVGQELIPEREKWEQRRDGMPWLLHVTWKAYEKFHEADAERELALDEIENAGKKDTERRRAFFKAKK